MTTGKSDEISRFALSRHGRVDAFVVVRGWTCLTLACLVTLGTANLAVAQEPGSSDPLTVPDEAAESDEVEDPFAGVEMMVVVGQSSASLLTSSTESVTRFDADTLQALGAADISDLGQITPNLEIRTADSTSPTFFIRGVGLSDFNANAGGAVAVYQDGVAMNSPALQLGQLFDIEGVEVLRGPQGAGAGRNASAGAIKVVSVKPVGEFRSFLTSSYGNYDAVDLEGALETPILGDELAARFSFRLSDRDGWGENGCAGLPSLAERDENGGELDRVTYCGEESNRLIPNPDGPGRVRLSRVPGGLEKNVNDVGTWAARGIFRYRPEGNETDWLLIARGGRTNQQSTLGQAVGTVLRYGGGRTEQGYRDEDITQRRDQLIRDCVQAGGTTCAIEADDVLFDAIARNLDKRPHRGDYNRVGKTKHDTWGASLQGEIPVADLIITTITAYDAYDRFRDQDDDFTPNTVFESETEDDAWQLSQEIHIAGELDRHALSWEVGGYYLMEFLDSDAIFFQGVRRSNQEYHQDTYSFAFHAGFSWEFLDDFTLEGGARYNWEQKHFEFGFNGPNASSSFKDEDTWQAPSGTVSLRYQVWEDASIYWKYSRGWKGGQFNASASRLANIEPADPESIDAFEVGVNGYCCEGRLGLSGALFYYNYSDYQVFIVEDNFGSFPQTLIINANEAEIYGAELEARIEPLLDLVPEAIDDLSLTVRFGWLESEFLDFTNQIVRSISQGPLQDPLVFPITVDYSGNQLINAPRFKVSIGAEWMFELGRLGDLTPRYDGTWSDDVYFDAAEGQGSVDADGNFILPDYAIGQKAFWLHNFSLRYRPRSPSNLEIMGWVRNMTNEAYKTFAFDGSVFGGFTVNYVGEPRTYGGTLRISF